MLRSMVVFIISLDLLVPICIVLGYGIGEIIAAYIYPVKVRWTGSGWIANCSLRLERPDGKVDQ